MSLLLAPQTYLGFLLSSQGVALQKAQEIATPPPPCSGPRARLTSLLSISHTKDLHRIQSLGKTDGGSFCFVLFVLWGPLKRNVYGFFFWKRGEIFEIRSLEENPEFFSLCCLLFLQGSDKIGMTEGPLSKRKYQENTYTLFLHVCIIYTLFIIYTLHNNYIAMYYIIDCI